MTALHPSTPLADLVQRMKGASAYELSSIVTGPHRCVGKKATGLSRSRPARRHAWSSTSSRSARVTRIRPFVSAG
ncbi:MAG: hypothetical protein J0L92_15220 [Deltaproteobacteria bacterium]|nr:hypothetical protein [Deltaproteobacteria bacterium]